MPEVRASRHALLTRETDLERAAPDRRKLAHLARLDVEVAAHGSESRRHPRVARAGLADLAVAAALRRKLADRDPSRLREEPTRANRRFQQGAYARCAGAAQRACRRVRHIRRAPNTTRARTD